MPQLIIDSRLLQGFNAAHQQSTAMLGMPVVLHVLAVVKHEVSGNRNLKRMSL